ncbi:hypothetical protein NS506_07531 [Nocardia seriolae]|nr:hypothetical protein NS506_07531 [Nocardia seriolae]
MTGNAGRVTGALLVVVGVLVVAASFTPLLQQELAYSGGRWEEYAWKTASHSRGGSYTYTHFQPLGVPFEIVAVLAALGGVLLLAGAGRRPGARWFGAFAAGAAVTFTVSMVSSLASAGGDFGYGLGFWLLVVAILGSIAALVNALREQPITPPDGAGGAADRTAAVFLMLASVATVSSEVLIMTALSAGKDFNGIRIIGDGWHVVDAVPVVMAVAVGVVAVLLFAGRGVHSRAVRIAGGIAAGAAFGSAMMQVFFNQIGLGFFPYGFDAISIGYWIGIVAVLLSLPAVIASLVAQLAKPRLRQPLRGYAPGFMPPPGPMSVAAMNPFAVAPVPNPFAPIHSSSNPFVQAAPAPNPFAPASPMSAVEATVKIEPEPAAVQPPRMAKVYDGKDGDGRPVMNREALEGNIRTAVLAYLESAPIVLAARSFEQDEFVPGERDVPLNFRTDGVWVWAGAVSHYLHKHGLPPEAELVRHIASRGYRVGEVGEAAKDAAVRVITGS